MLILSHHHLLARFGISYKREFKINNLKAKLLPKKCSLKLCFNTSGGGSDLDWNFVS